MIGVVFSFPDEKAENTVVVTVPCLVSLRLKKAPSSVLTRTLLHIQYLLHLCLMNFRVSGSGVRARVGITGHKQPEAVSPACDVAKAQIRLYRLSVAATV